MRPSTGAQYRHVQGLSRGLAILHAINRSLGGYATINDLSQQTGLHRTTVRRLLETLQAEGYVRRSASDDSYRLNHKIRQLSDGFTDDEWISEVANPVLGELLQKLVWPSDLCTLDGDSMLVRETTHRFSPLSFHRAMVRQRLPLLQTASGKAYLANCGETECEHLIELVSNGEDAQAQLARNRTFVAQVLDKVRSQGYATNDGEWHTETKIGALALPIRHEANVCGTLNVVFLRKAMSIDEAVRRYLPPLRQAIEKIECQLHDAFMAAP